LLLILTQKEIKFLTVVDGPIESALSTNGNYLLLCGTNVITVIDTRTNEYFSFNTKNLYSANKNQLHVLDHVHWINDSQFSYLENEYHNKFQNTPDSVTKKSF